MRAPTHHPQSDRAPSSSAPGRTLDASRSVDRIAPMWLPDATHGFSYAIAHGAVPDSVLSHCKASITVLSRHAPRRRRAAARGTGQ